MKTQTLFDSLEGFPKALSALLTNLPKSLNTWKPDEKSWCLLEILGHLIEEEKEDFSLRLKLTLENPKQDWPPLDPEAKIRNASYRQQKPAKLLKEFEDLRENSLRWLKSLKNPLWEFEKTHPKLGPLKAGDLLLAWAEHDWLHYHQIVKRMFQLLAEEGKPFSPNYAGPGIA